RREAGVRRFTARPVLMTLPVDPAGSSDSGGLVTRPPPPPPASRLRWFESSSPTDPAFPGGSAWEKFYGPRRPPHKGFPGLTSTHSEFRIIDNNTPPTGHKLRPN